MQKVVALTDTQKSEYWKKDGSYITLQPGFLRLALLALTHWSTHVAFHLPFYFHHHILFTPGTPHLSLRLQSSSAVRRPETCASIPDGGTCEDAALFWSFCDEPSQQQGRSSSLHRNPRSKSPHRQRRAITAAAGTTATTGELPPGTHVRMPSPSMSVQ